MKSFFFLGLDCSSQSLSAVVIDYSSKQVVYEKSLNFDQTFPQYKTVKGFLRSSDPLVVHSPPLLWVEALDLLLQEMSKDISLKSIAAIGGSAQQHGSVYLNSSAEERLKHLDASITLKENIQDIFSRKTAPVWMDASTSVECEEIRKALGGRDQVIIATGSNAFERFTGPQIRKFFKTEAGAYANTAHIALVSSFMASLIAGKIAPIDVSDGSGMNLMDIQKKSWHKKAMEATAPHLEKKLPPLVESWKILGPINPYFQKYGFSSDALALVWSGDNPNSLVGLGLVKEGMTGMSLGTSFTYFGCLQECLIDLKGEGHLFASPMGDYMSLLCFKNGALAIESARKMYAIDWEGFNQALKSTSPGNQGGIILPYFEPEIVPFVPKPGLHRKDLPSDDVLRNCRAIVEAQMMSMKLHAAWMKVKPSVIYATGGVSNNPLILQIAADVHNCPVIQLSVSKSSALGAALRAAHGYFGYKNKQPSWEEVVEPFVTSLFTRKVLPDPQAAKIYERLIEKYASFEKSIFQL